MLRFPQVPLFSYKNISNILFLIAFSGQLLGDEIASQPLLSQLIQAAKVRATQDYVSPKADIPKALTALDYTAYRAIRFNPEAAIWRETKETQLQLFHPGWLYASPVNINIIEASGQLTPLSFNSDTFIYEREAAVIPPLSSPHLGFAGFRVHHPINDAVYKDEFLLFQGASYFRFVSAGQRYGLSARGLAIDTAEIGGEEFPHFTEFWVQEPKTGHPLRIYAQLDSPSITGMYQFDVTPGKPTHIEVSAWLFARKDIAKLGIAPLTSMYLYGENQPSTVADYRPEVHDSDGLMVVEGGGQAIWRPLINPTDVSVTSQRPANIQGFGLLQRDRNFEHYLDTEALYHKRPGIWVTPLSGFDEGYVELVEIPTVSETFDNIVSYWVSKPGLKKGEARVFRYCLDALDQYPDTLKWPVLRTRIGNTGIPGERVGTERRFVIDFAVPLLTDNPEQLALTVTSSAGHVSEPVVVSLQEEQTVRATFTLAPAKGAVHDMRAHISNNTGVISEVWNYVYKAK